MRYPPGCVPLKAKEVNRSHTLGAEVCGVTWGSTARVTLQAVPPARRRKSTEATPSRYLPMDQVCGITWDGAARAIRQAGAK
eukprot:4774737-Pyramimonas_sp.AAC.1